MKEPKVLLVSMPWASYQEPSLGLSILSAILNDEGITNDIKYFNTLLLKYLKAETYSQLAEIQGINEFLFSSAFEEHISTDQILVLDNTLTLLLQSNHGVTNISTKAEYFEFLLKIRNEIIPKYLEDCVTYITDNNYSLVGFTCMFDQTIANLALAKLLKQRQPDVTICFGGYAIEGEVGAQILKSFDFVDIISNGDGEPMIMELANFSVGRANIGDIPNIYYRENDNIKTNIKKKIQIDNSPDPFYGDFFKELELLHSAYKVLISPKVLSVESSRGCWWGQKSHCVFCGIDEETLKYRLKNEDNVVRMFDRMSMNYPGFTFRLVDYILPYQYFQTVLPKLATRVKKLKISCEMKSNITFENFKLLSNAGFIQVQPGIESFSSNVLKKMKKGVSAIQNVLTLKLGKKLGIQVDWNLLYGFPNDEFNDYKPLIGIIPSLYHFNAPHSCTNVLVTRFAPLQTKPGDFGLEKSTPHRSYNIIFSQKFRTANKFDLDNYCYIYETNWTNSDDLEVLFRLIDAQVSYWKTAQESKNCFLKHQTINNEIYFYDNRLLSNKVKEYKYPESYGHVYKYIDTSIKSFENILTEFNNVISESEIKSILSDLVDKRFVFQENNKFVGLSIEISMN